MRLIVGNVHDEIETRRSAEAKARRARLPRSADRLAEPRLLAKGHRRRPALQAGGCARRLLHAISTSSRWSTTRSGTRAGDELLEAHRRADRAHGRQSAPSSRARQRRRVYRAHRRGERRERHGDRGKPWSRRPRSRWSPAGTWSRAAFRSASPSPTRRTQSTALLRNAALALGRGEALGAPARRHVQRRDGGEARGAGATSSATLAAAMLRRRDHARLSADPPRRGRRHGRRRGAGALAAPGARLVSPVEFIAAAEETGQILELGEHILRTALRDAGALARPLRLGEPLARAVPPFRPCGRGGDASSRRAGFAGEACSSK